MKIAILGAGSMGSLYASFLYKHHDVLLIDSYAPQVEAVRASGVTVTELDNSIRNCPVDICMSGEAKEPCELLIVFVKNPATDAALDQNRALIGENTLILSLQNGLGNDKILKKYVAPERILLGTSKHNCTLTEPGCIKQAFRRRRHQHRFPLRSA